MQHLLRNGHVTTYMFGPWTNFLACCCMTGVPFRLKLVSIKQLQLQLAICIQSRLTNACNMVCQAKSCHVLHKVYRSLRAQHV